MRILKSSAFLVLAIFAFGACNSMDRSASNTPPAATNANVAANPIPATKAKQPETIHADGVRRLDVQEAQALIAKGQAVVVDVRNQAAFDQGHIPGAKLIPVNEVVNRTGELPKDKTIITYCS